VIEHLQCATGAANDVRYSYEPTQVPATVVSVQQREEVIRPEPSERTVIDREVILGPLRAQPGQWSQELLNRDAYLGLALGERRGCVKHRDQAFTHVNMQRITRRGLGFPSSPGKKSKTIHTPAESDPTIRPINSSRNRVQ